MNQTSQCMNHWCLLLLILSACTATKPTSSIHPFSGDQVGCGDFIVYKLSDEGRQVVSIAINMQEMEDNIAQNYRLNNASAIAVKWKVYQEDIRASLCNDVMVEKPLLLQERTAKSGSVEISVSDSSIEKRKERETYKVTLILKKVNFGDVTIDYLKIQNVNVGWLPG